MGKTNKKKKKTKKKTQKKISLNDEEDSLRSLRIALEEVP